MESSSAAQSGPSRPGLATRKRARRRAARRRIAARVRRPLTDEQKGFDPTDREAPRLADRLGAAALFLVYSACAHVAVIAAAVALFGDLDDAEERSAGPVAVEVRDREQEPEPKPIEEEVEPEPALEEKVEPKKIEQEPPEKKEIEKREPPPKQKEPPPESDPPPKKQKPRKVTGLDMESTVEGGGGPSFATGNTRAGETSGRAVSPDDVEPGPAEEEGEEQGERESPNNKATRIPTSGAEMVLPKRKKPVKPAYPPELEAQGIEANVPVLVKIDASGAVESVKVLKESGYPEFDEAARRAALAEEFEPATRNGKPIPYTLSYTYRFRVEEK